MPLFSSAASNVASLIRLFPGALKGRSPGKVLSGPKFVRNETRLTTPGASGTSHAPLFTKNVMCSGRGTGQTQVGAQLQRLGNLHRQSAPVLQRMAATTAASLQERHALCFPAPPVEDAPRAQTSVQSVEGRAFTATERMPLDPQLSIHETGTPLEREQINARTPPRARELHPKALARQARLHVLQVPRRADARAEAQPNADTLAALQPTTGVDSALIETVNPAFYTPLFARIEVTDAGTHDGLGSGGGDWDLMAAFEPFKERIERLEVAMHPPIVEIDGHEPGGMDARRGESEVDVGSVKSLEEGNPWASDWDDDFDSDFDSDFESDSDFDSGDEFTEEAPTQVAPRGEPPSPRHLEIAKRLRTAFDTRKAEMPQSEQQALYVPQASLSVARVDATEQLKLDVLRYQPELEAFDQLPLAVQREGAESSTPAGGKKASREDRPAFLDVIESFNKDTLRKVGTIAKAPASDVEQSFGGGFAEMLKTHKESLLEQSHTDSGLENDADSDWDS
ncbi:hypothetical protein [Stenotrophomonas sp.]|uniref:hypothetical protein n=1 Tax=Stenotrophomonas sp. TaxID=69392 RepID=UPI0028A704C7|nr:hypothetical protein [Stenotrophomonas sp.]